MKQAKPLFILLVLAIGFSTIGCGGGAAVTDEQTASRLLDALLTAEDAATLSRYLDDPVTVETILLVYEDGVLRNEATESTSQFVSHADLFEAEGDGVGISGSIFVHDRLNQWMAHYGPVDEEVSVFTQTDRLLGSDGVHTTTVESWQSLPYRDNGFVFTVELILETTWINTGERWYASDVTITQILDGSSVDWYEMWGAAAMEADALTMHSF